MELYAGRHELADTDWGEPHDAVTLYGEITDFVMPLPRPGSSPRHARNDNMEACDDH